jgi:hypothetical protein
MGHPTIDPVRSRRGRLAPRAPFTVGLPRAALASGIVAAGLVALPAGPIAAATPVTYTVTSTGDAGDATIRANCADGTDPCTLRAALLEANAHPNDAAGVDVIQFAIPGPAPHVIAVADSLPLITDPVTVDAGLPAAGTPRSVEVTGHSCRNGSSFACGGLVTRVGSTTLRGLAVNGFFQGFRAVPPTGVRMTEVVLEGNFFGTDASGHTLVGPPSGVTDGDIGVLLANVDASRIGGDPALGAGNLVAGHGVREIDVSNSSRVQLLGNLVGVAADGATPLGSTTSGIWMQGGSGSVIGSPGAGNVVSGLGGVAVFVHSAVDTRIQANRVGTDATGASAVPNRTNGIEVKASAGTTVGGSPAAGNVISANAASGLVLTDAAESGRSGGEVSYNRIGTDAAGTSALGNGTVGLGISSGASYYVHDNVISGNGRELAGNGHGVVFGFGSTGNRVEENKIGVGADGRSLGNAGAGILASYDPFAGGSGNIGAVGAGNEIAFNGTAGVIVTGSSGVADQPNPPPLPGVTIRGNSIHDNGGVPGVLGLGIDLRSNTDSPSQGPDEIDPLDADDGVNQRQNAPEILDVVIDGTTSTITGRLRSVPGENFTVDVYANPECDPSGYGEGEAYLGTVEVATPAASNPEAGTAQFTLTVPRSVASAGIAATATNRHGSSSEFSACLAAPERTTTTTTYTGPSEATYSDPLTMSGQLTDPSTQPPTGIPDAQLSFTLADQAPVHASPTDHNGNVIANPIVVTMPPGAAQVITSFAGNATHVGSSDSDPVTIAKEDCTLSYVGDTLVSPRSPTRLAAQFGELDPYPGDWSGKTVTFLVTTTADTSVQYTAVTNNVGLAEVTVPLNADVYAVTGAFAGDRFYTPCATPTDTLLTVSAATAKVTGGGWISNSIGRTSFGFNAVPQTDGTFKGQFQLRSNSDKSKLHSTTVAALTVVSRTSVSWTGNGRWNGVPGYTFEATVVDQGSSGSKKGDTISIKVYPTGVPNDPVFTTETPQTLRGGNITIH